MQTRHFQSQTQAKNVLQRLRNKGKAQRNTLTPTLQDIVRVDGQGYHHGFIDDVIAAALYEDETGQTRRCSFHELNRDFVPLASAA